MIYNKSPTYNHLWVFGCLCFPLIPSTKVHKLRPRSSPCVFLEYPSLHKGYKCYDHSFHKIILSQHFLFDDCNPFLFFQLSSSQCSHTAEPNKRPQTSFLPLHPPHRRQDLITPQHPNTLNPQGLYTVAQLHLLPYLLVQPSFLLMISLVLDLHLPHPFHLPYQLYLLYLYSAWLPVVSMAFSKPIPNTLLMPFPSPFLLFPKIPAKTFVTQTGNKPWPMNLML